MSRATEPDIEPKGPPETEAHSPQVRASVEAIQQDDPLSRVLDLDGRMARTGEKIGMAVALWVHGAFVLLALTILPTQENIQAAVQMVVFDIAVAAAAEPPPPPPEPEPVPVAPPPEPPPEVKPEPETEDPYEEVDTPPAEAAKVLTAPPQPNEPPAPPDKTFASGDGDGLGYGMVAGAGTGDGVTYDPRARVKNVSKGPLPEAKTPPQPRAVTDLSRPAALLNGIAGECEFPSGATTDLAFVQVSVIVGPDGKAVDVQILSDPGQGFGRAARVCAMGSIYRPGRDATGRPAVTKTPPIRVRFTR